MARRTHVSVPHVNQGGANVIGSVTCTVFVRHGRHRQLAVKDSKPAARSAGGTGPWEAVVARPARTHVLAVIVYKTDGTVFDSLVRRQT